MNKLSKNLYILDIVLIAIEYTINYNYNVIMQGINFNQRPTS